MAVADVDIGGVGQPEALLQPRDRRTFGLWPLRLRQGNFGTGLRLARRAQLARGAGPFFEDAGRPDRSEMAKAAAPSSISRITVG